MQFTSNWRQHLGHVVNFNEPLPVQFQKHLHRECENLCIFNTSLKFINYRTAHISRKLVYKTGNHPFNKSTHGRLIPKCFVLFAEHRGIVAPVIVESTGTVTVAQDEGAALICIAQGCPTPEYRYYFVIFFSLLGFSTIQSISY